MLRSRRPLRRALAAAVTVGVFAAAGTLLSAGGVAAQTTTIDGVTTAAPDVAMVGGTRQYVSGDAVAGTGAISVFGSFSLKVDRETVFSEVRLALRSTSVPGDAYDTGRQYDVTVTGTRSFSAQREVPDGDWSAAALWLKDGRWNSGPWTTFSIRNGTVSIGSAPTGGTDAVASPPAASPAPAPVVVAPSPTPTQAPAPSPTVLRLGDFEGERQWDDSANVLPNPGGTVTVDSTRAYSGTSSARAHIPAGPGNKYARTIWGGAPGSSSSMDRGEGSDTWYGMALYLPVGFYDSMQGYYVPMRWDNYGYANVSRTGLAMWPDGSMRLFRERAGVENQVNLLGTTTFRLAEGTWHWLEVHQKLSATDGAAVNEVYVDGALIGRSTARNFYGEPLTYLRYGVVAVDGGRQTQALTVWYDRATVSSERVGPRA